MSEGRGKRNVEHSHDFVMLEKHLYYEIRKIVTFGASAIILNFIF